MNGQEEYIRQVNRRLAGMDLRVKQDIIKELRAHIVDLVNMHGGSIQAAISQLEPPDRVGRRYRQVYGYANVFKVLFVLVAGTLAIFTLPVLQISGEEVTIPVLLSLAFLGILVAYLIYLGVAAGRGVGLMAGVVACFTRLAVFGMLALAGGSNVILQGGGVALLVVASLILIFVGYIPGEAKARWKKPTGEL